MDIAVQITMIVLFLYCIIAAIICFVVGKKWQQFIAGLIYFLGAAFIAYGLYIQCDGMAVFYRCGG